MYFEFADSEVARCQWSGGQLQMRFSAARLLDAQDLRADAVWAPLLLMADNVEPCEDMEPAACIGRLVRGLVLHASQRIQKLPVPCELRGTVTMELEFAQGTTLRLRCDSLSLHPVQTATTQAYQC